MARVCVVGNATKDINEAGLISARRPGGTLLYASLALDRLGHEVQPMGYAPLRAYLALRQAGLPTGQVRLALRATKFKNSYDGFERVQRVRPGSQRSVATKQALDGYAAVLLGPVLGEVPADLVVPEEALTLLDVQGFVRQLGPRDLWGWREVQAGEPTSGLPEVDVLCGSLDELEAWLDTEDPAEAARALRTRSSDLAVVTMGPEGALAQDGTEHRARPEPVDVDDPTGSGDVFDAGLLHGLLTYDDSSRALRFACGAAAAFLERSGEITPERFPTPEQARKRAPGSTLGE